MSFFDASFFDDTFFDVVTLPTLSAATLINLGANSATPRVTVTY